MFTVKEYRLNSPTSYLICWRSDDHRLVAFQKLLVLTANFFSLLTIYQFGMFEFVEKVGGFDVVL